MPSSIHFSNLTMSNRHWVKRKEFCLQFCCGSMFESLAVLVMCWDYARTRRSVVWTFHGCFADEPTFRPSRPTNQWKTTAFCDFPDLSRSCIFFLLLFSSTLLCFSSLEVWLKKPSFEEWILFLHERIKANYLESNVLFTVFGHVASKCLST